MPAAALATHRYESSVVSRLGNAVGGVLLSILAAFLITKFGLAEAANVRSDTVLVTTFVVLVAVGVALSLVRSFVIAPVRIDVTPEVVEVFTGRTRRHTLPRTEYAFGSFVVQNATTRTASERRLIATSASRRLEIPCPGFSSAAFGDLVNELAAPSREAASNSPASTWTGAPFVLDPRGRMLGIAITLGVFLVALVASLAGVIALSLTEPVVGSDSVSVLVLVGFGVVAFGVPLALLTARLVKLARIPRRIELTAISVTIGESLFRLDELTRVELTPETYRGFDKRITLTRRDGRRVRYLLETGGILVRRPVFPEYGAFAQELSRRLPPGVVRYELG